MLVVEFDIPAGRVADFEAATAPIIEATSAEAGTLRYDWYLSEDGLRGLNLERFEEPPLSSSTTVMWRPSCRRSTQWRARAGSA